MEQRVAAGAPTLAMPLVRARSRRRDFVRGLMGNKGALAGLIVLILLILAAIFAPLITTYDPIVIDPGWGSIRAGLQCEIAAICSAPTSPAPLAAPVPSAVGA